jgi:phosphopantothenate--cysteine ligase
MTHILITSGGTLVPIDPVRNISNNSTGSFGSAIAAQALKAGMEVSYLTSRHGQSPFSQRVDFNQQQDWHETEDKLKELHDFADKYRPQYHEHRYQTYNEYASDLKLLVTKKKPEIILLAAAVSDYLVANYSHNKVRSNMALHVDLEPAPKLIHSIREWSPESFIVGFKLMVNVSETELIDTAKNSIAQHHLDLCVANDLVSIQSGTHKIFIVNRDGSVQSYNHNLAAEIIAKCLQGIRS